MTLHVQASNKAALSFYEKHGFDVKEKLEGYYKELDDADCFVLEKNMDLDTIVDTEESKQSDDKL